MTTALKQCPLTKKEDGVFIKPASDLPKEPEVTVWSLLTDSHLLSGDFDGLGYDSVYNFEIRAPRVKNKGHQDKP